MYCNSKGFTFLMIRHFLGWECNNPCLVAEKHVFIWKVWVLKSIELGLDFSKIQLVMKVRWTGSWPKNQN